MAAALLGALVLLLIVMPGRAAGAIGPTDLSLTKSDSADPVTVGTNFSYTIAVKNEGLNDASAVTVTDTLPSQVGYVSATPSAGTCTKSGSKVTCNLGQVNTATSASISIVVKASSSGTASNTASLTSVDDTNAANNQDTETTTINKVPSAPKTKTKKGKGSKLTCATPTIVGTNGNDVIQGTNGADSILGLGGNDQIFGNGGNDAICAGDGADLVNGGSGADIIVGGPGPDFLIGEDGGDAIKGKSGRDRLLGMKGNDLLNGGHGRDKCKGGPGRNLLRSCP